MWACEPAAAALSSVLWVSQASMDNGEYATLHRSPHDLGVFAAESTGTVAKYGMKKKAEAVKRCRDIGKKDMKLNNAMPKMQGASSGPCRCRDM